MTSAWRNCKRSRLAKRDRSVACGSPPYMAPEQAEPRLDEIGPGTDVYGLGTILYELLTGRPPFSAPATWKRCARSLPTNRSSRGDCVPVYRAISRRSA